MNNNGYSDSIMNTESGRCFLCGAETETARHEIYFGSANRRLSKKYGLWVDICPMCHQYGEHAVHRDRNADLFLKRIGQNRFEKEHSREEFMKIFGRSYL